MKGKFITFEGVEGCGKSTQIRLLAKFFDEKKIPYVVTREPGGTEISDKIRDLLLDPSHIKMAPITELLLYEASRAQHVFEVINPALSAGRVVLCDRFADSSRVYQGYARGLGEELVDECNEIATGGIKPDLTFLLDIPVEVGLERVRKKGMDRLEQEDVGFHKRVREGFLLLAKKEPKRVFVLDATGGIEEVQEKIRKVVEERFPLWR
ncbi:MAG TPA: dTMP kinase [Bdellovibrionota bacterium]|nr:dTMP kinase [Bdellovibrionota bacterium]